MSSPAASGEFRPRGQGVGRRGFPTGASQRRDRGGVNVETLTQETYAHDCDPRIPGHADQKGIFPAVYWQRRQVVHVPGISPRCVVCE